MNLKLYTTILLLGLFSTTLSAQLFIDDSYTPEEMVMDFFSNSCVTPSNIVYTGSDQSIAFFDAGGTDLGTQAGIYFSTGNVFDAIGPNTQGGTSTSLGEPGDSDLNDLLMGWQTNDATVLEMDIFSTGSQLDFSYVFASEEYPEFVNSGFNDIFAFFISGPGISGLQNIAMVPSSSDFVSINTINSNTNSQYYVDNTNGMDIEFDGYTTELIASATVTPNETYQIKIAIADVSDNVFDSGIFLGIESLCGEENLTPPANHNLTVDGLTVTFENSSKYATSYLWDFGDNTTSTERHPEPHTYAMDGIYDIKLITYNYCCSDTITTTLTVGNPNSVQNPEVQPFTLSPNPVRDQLQLQFENNQAFELHVYDSTGRMMHSKIGQGTTSLQLENLDPGIYFIEVQIDQKVYVNKFVKVPR